MNHRYEFLDGLRGVAAIVVVLLHFVELIGLDRALVPHGYLAVDFFFCLSGFVLAHAYNARLGNHLTVGDFYLSRLIRLYPMLIVGLATNTVVIALRLFFQAESKEIWSLLGASLANLFQLPSSIFLGKDAPAWAANPPQWSLFFECLASLAFPWLLRATDRLLITLMVLSGAAVMAYALANTNLNVGNNWNTWPLGSIRVAYPFIAGICLCRYSLKSHRQKSASGLKSIACVVLLVAIFFVQVPESMNGIYEAAAVLVLLPALMMFSASLTPTSRSRHFIVWLGAISYPLYATHYVVIRTVAGILRRLEGVNPWHYGIVVTGTVAACLLIAWLCLRKIDEPVRRWLTVRVSMAGRMRRASVG